tara:strand:- start:369 stop:761 length:393 start_codon:yes stop_codon:yes gene_type:complete
MTTFTNTKKSQKNEVTSIETKSNKSRNVLDIFNTTKIYEFGIKSPHGMFYEYAKVVFDPENENYKIYSYYRSENIWRPCKTTRNGEYDIIEFHKVAGEFVVFKGPRFTEGPRKGRYDPWVLTKRIFDMPS